MADMKADVVESLSQQDALKVMKDLPQDKVSIILRDHLASSFMD